MTDNISILVFSISICLVVHFALKIERAKKKAEQLDAKKKSGL